MLHTAHGLSQALPSNPLLHAALEQALLWHLQTGQCDAAPPSSYGKDSSQTGQCNAAPPGMLLGQESKPESLRSYILHPEPPWSGRASANGDPAYSGKMCGADTSDHRAVFTDCLLCAVHTRDPKICGMVMHQERGFLEPHIQTGMGRTV